MGQQIVGGKPPSSCLPMLGCLLVCVTLCALLAWLEWPR